MMRLADPDRGRDTDCMATQRKTHPVDLFEDGCTPVTSGEAPYVFQSYPPGTRANLTATRGRTARLSEVPSTLDVRPTESGTQDNIPTETAWIRAPRPVPAPIILEYGEMLGLQGRAAFECAGMWSLWLNESVIFTFATEQMARTWALYGRLQ